MCDLLVTMKKYRKKPLDKGSLLADVWLLRIPELDRAIVERAAEQLDENFEVFEGAAVALNRQPQFDMMMALVDEPQKPSAEVVSIAKGVVGDLATEAHVELMKQDGYAEFGVFLDRVSKLALMVHPILHTKARGSRAVYSLYSGYDVKLAPNPTLVAQTMHALVNRVSIRYATKEILDEVDKFFENPKKTAFCTRYLRPASDEAVDAAGAADARAVTAAAAEEGGHETTPPSLVYVLPVHPKMCGGALVVVSDSLEEVMDEKTVAFHFLSQTPFFQLFAGEDREWFFDSIEQFVDYMHVVLSLPEPVVLFQDLKTGCLSWFLPDSKAAMIVAEQHTLPDVVKPLDELRMTMDPVGAVMESVALPRDAGADAGVDTGARVGSISSGGWTRMPISRPLNGILRGVMFGHLSLDDQSDLWSRIMLCPTIAMPAKDACEFVEFHPYAVYKRDDVTPVIPRFLKEMDDGGRGVIASSVLRRLTNFYTGIMHGPMLLYNIGVLLKRHDAFIPSDQNCRPVQLLFDKLTSMTYEKFVEEIAKPFCAGTLDEIDSTTAGFNPIEALKAFHDTLVESAADERPIILQFEEHNKFPVFRFIEDSAVRSRAVAQARKYNAGVYHEILESEERSHAVLESPMGFVTLLYLGPLMWTEALLGSDDCIKKFIDVLNSTLEVRWSQYLLNIIVEKNISGLRPNYSRGVGLRTR